MDTTIQAFLIVCGAVMFTTLAVIVTTITTVLYVTDLYIKHCI